jgi:hypothetical protein
VRRRRRLGLHAASAASFPLLPATPAGDGEGNAPRLRSADGPNQCSPLFFSFFPLCSPLPLLFGVKPWGRGIGYP